MEDFSFGVFLGVFLGLFLGLFFWGHISASGWESTIIEKGYGLYCPKNGEFAFIEECNKDEN